LAIRIGRNLFEARDWHKRDLVIPALFYLAEALDPAIRLEDSGQEREIRQLLADWSTKMPVLRAVLPRQPTGTAGPIVFDRTVVFSPDGRYAVVGAASAVTAWYDLATQKTLGQIDRHISAAAFHPGGTRLLLGHRLAPGGAQVWDVLTGTSAGERLSPRPNIIVEDVRYRPDGKTFLTAGPAPTELASVERVILHYQEGLSAGPAPTELASVERVILHYQEVERGPRPHRACLGGARDFALPGRFEWGRGRRAAPP